MEAVGGGAKVAAHEAPAAAASTPAPSARSRFFSQGRWHDAPVWRREAIAPGAVMPGPGIVIEPHQTIVIETAGRAALTARDHLVLSRVVPLARRAALGTDADPVMLEIFNNLFMSSPSRWA